MNYDWVQPTLERISDILRMPDGHNSYGTPKVDPRVAWEAVYFLGPVASSRTPSPTISPTKNGGLSISWAGTNTVVELVSDPTDSRKAIRINISGTPGCQPVATIDQQTFETALRVVERELELATGRPEEAKP